MSRLLIYYGGELGIADEFTPSYIGGSNRLFLVAESISLSMLKQRVMHALRIDSTSNTVNLICRLRNNSGYCAIHMSDDEVSEFILVDGRTHTVVVYVEVQEICIRDEADPSNQYQLPDPTANSRREGGLRNNIDMVEEFNESFNLSDLPTILQPEGHTHRNVNERPSTVRRSPHIDEGNEATDQYLGHRIVINIVI